MNRICYVIVSMLFPLVVNAEVKVEASETVELMSVLSRLAGYNEYCEETGSYASDIDTWFANYRNHETVSYHKQLRQNYGIAYDAVASMGIHLTIENGSLKLLSDRSLLENRWRNVDLDEFLSKLNSFYTDVNFHNFYVEHQDYYAASVNAYKAGVLVYFNQDWYAQFYGTEPNENYWVIVSFNNGGSNYGVKRQAEDGKRDVMNVCTYRAGQNDKSYAETLIHEFNHSFVNPLLDNSSTNSHLIKNAGEWLLMFSQQIMRNSAYGDWSTVINESIVRAGVVNYMLDNGFSADEIDSHILYEISVGFTWTPELVKALRYYSNHRDEYKTLNDYYPVIASCLEDYVNDMRNKIADCTGLPKEETIDTNIDDISYQFKTNRDTPTTLTLVSADWNKNVTTLSIPATVLGHQVTTIGDYSFYQKEYAASEIAIPEGVVEIGKEAFSWSSGIKYITLPSTLKTIGDYAFQLCGGLEEITIPASVESLGMRFLNHMNNLTRIVVDKNNPRFDSRDDCNAVIETTTNTLIHGCKTSTVPKGVTAIGELAFIECQAMTRFVIPSWVTSIGDYAFYYCNGLKELYSQIEKPFNVAENLFTSLPEDAILYVPIGSKEKYEATQGWNKIKNIIEMDMSGIKDATASTNEKNSVFYNLQGQPVKNPSKGIYIKNNKKVVVD